MFLVRAVHNGGAADLCYLLTVPKEGPATDLLATNDVLDEENAPVESQRHFVEQLNVLQQVVIRVTARRGASDN